MFFKLSKGESFQKIFEEQRNIELLQLGGEAKKLLANPKAFLSTLKLRLKVWSKTFSHCKGWEKAARIATQIITPTLGVLAVAGITAAVIMGGPITWISAAVIGSTILSGSIATASKTDLLFNKIFPTYQQTLRQIEDEKQLKAKQAMIEKVIDQRQKFIHDLQTNGSLPKFSEAHLPQLTEQQNKIYQKRKEELIHELKLKLNQKWKEKADKTAVDCVQVLIKEGLSQIKINVETFMSEVKDSTTHPEAFLHLLSQDFDSLQFQAAMANEMIQALIEDWLGPHIDNIFAERMFQENQEVSYKPQDPNEVIKKEIKKANLGNVKWEEVASILKTMPSSA